MSDAERKVRMHRMRTQLRCRTFFYWLAAILERSEDIIAERTREIDAA
jgi:hypothetical protein